MNKKFVQYISVVILILGGGVITTQYISTLESLSRPLRDILGMLALFTCLALAGILIVAILIRIDEA